MATPAPELVPTKLQDFLDEDPVLRGQNYVCLSFLSPEDILTNKEAFYMQEYVANFSTDLNKIVDEIVARHPDTSNIFNNLKDTYSHFFKPADIQDDFRTFKSLHTDRIEKAFHELNEFRTTIRGIKVRGVFDTVQEAKNRADFLKRTGDKFDIFIAQVGCWCPWSPNPHDISDQEYAETQLNTFMKKYKDNIAHKDIMYEQRKQQSVGATSVEDITKKIEQIDPWTAAKSAESTQ
jgi:hypothetical protein